MVLKGGGGQPWPEQTGGSLRPLRGDRRPWTILYIQHSLVNDGVASSLADHEISPLDDNDRHKERRVTRELQPLALSVSLENTDEKRK